MAVVAVPANRRSRVCPFWAACLWLLGAVLPCAGASRQVLLLHSYDTGYEWTDRVTAGIRSGLPHAPRATDLLVEYMDVRRHGAVDHLDRLAAFYRAKYAGWRFDAVVPADDAALTFVLRHRDELFPGTPVVFCGVHLREREELEGRPWLTGVLETPGARQTLELVLQVHAGTRGVLVVGDNDSLPEDRKVGSNRPGVVSRFVNAQDRPVWALLDEVAALPRDHVVLLLGFSRDGDGKQYTPGQAAELVSARAAVPVYGINSETLRHGIAGGRLNDGFAHGQQAADLLRRVLAGESPAALGIRRDPRSQAHFDHRQLVRWGIPVAKLPPNSVVVERSPSLFEAYRTEVWGVLALFALQAAIISALLASISRRKEAERQLRQSEESLARAQSLAQLGSWERDMATDAIRWSAETVRIFGHSEAGFEPTLARFRQQVHPDDRDALLAASQRTRDAGEPYALEHRILRPDGSVRMVQARGELILDGDGRPLRMRGTVQDVTERRELERQLAQAQKMDAIGRLAGGVAHDFNNLLTVINGYSDLLLARLPEQDALRRPLKEISRAGQRAAALTGQLLAFSRKQILQVRLVDMGEVVRDMCDLLRPLVGEHVSLTLDLPSAPVWVRGDPAQLAQVVMNLAVNARDAMPRGGTLTVQVREGGQDGANRPTHVLLRVTDTGLGMDEVTRAHLFEPFFTTKADGRGTGLGLSTVYGIVRQSGGTIGVESLPGEGTTFRILLPRVEAEVAPPASAQDGPEQGPACETVLLVEDQENVRTLAERVLTERGYRVLVAADGREALTVCERHSGVDLVITDVRMPLMGGWDLASQLERRHPGLRIMFITGYAGEPHAPEQAVRGSSLVLRKPFTPDELTSSVREALRG